MMGKVEEREDGEYFVVPYEKRKYNYQKLLKEQFSQDDDHADSKLQCSC